MENLITESQPDDTTTTYWYDEENRLQEEKVASTSTQEVVFRDIYQFYPNGLRQSVSEYRSNPDGSDSRTTTQWTYDNDGRLTSETLTITLDGPNAPTPYTDTWTYDLDGNRISQVNVSNGTTDTTTSSYNTDGELTQTIDSVSGTTTYGYDANGDQETVTDGSSVTTDGYDLRGRLISVTANGSTTTYTYDTDGNRTSETTGGTTTYYLNDPNSPTGYAKPVEQWGSVDGSRGDATLSMSYMIGLSVVGQSGGTGSYFLADGGGSTRALLNSSGVVTAAFNYDAFGDPIGFNPSTAGTIYLFGGDGMYDAPSGLYFHGSGRQSDNANDRFIEADAPGYGSNADPITLNMYLLDGANPISMRDPSGHDLVGILGAMSIANMIDSIEFTGFTATYDSAKGVEAGENTNQVLENFLIQQAIGVGIGIGIGAAASAIGALRNGISLDFSLFTALDQFIPETEAAAGEIGQVEAPGASNLNLSNEFPGINGEYLGDSRPTFQELADLSRKNNVEYVLVYKAPQGSTSGGGGSYTLYSGNQGAARFPIDENTRLIVHTHPGGTAGPSQADIDVLLQLQGQGSPQRSSQIIAVGDESFQVVRYNSNSTPLP